MKSKVDLILQELLAIYLHLTMNLFYSARIHIKSRTFSAII